MEFKKLNIAGKNENMVIGHHHYLSSIEGIRLHLNRKTAVYFKHGASKIDGFSTDGIYRMQCTDETEKYNNQLNGLFNLI